MFTGIIEKVGRLACLEDRGDGARLVIEHPAWSEPLAPGESVAVQGACLTAVTCAKESFTCDVLRETLVRTCLVEKRPGSLLNLERAMRADGRFGGHLVSGHVDGTGSVTRLDAIGRDWLLEVECGRELTVEMVQKGSITLDGISLTVTQVAEDRFQVHLIPFTWENTSIQEVRVGNRVNLETDLVGKYVRKYLATGHPIRQGLALEDLRRAGFA